MNNCHFCNKEYRLVSFVVTHYWYLCDFCNIVYQHNYNTNDLEVIRFKTIINDEKYCLDLLLKDSISEVLHIPFNSKKKDTLLLRLPFLVQGINPSNCQDKIKTYIIFS